MALAQRFIFLTLSSFCIALFALQPAAHAFASSYDVEINKGRLLKLNSPATSVVVADPEIVDIQVISPQMIYINGRSIGETSLLAVNGGNRVVMEATISVTHNLSKLQKTVSAAFPNSSVSFESTDSAIVMRGDAASPFVAERIQRLASSFLRGEQSIINLTDTSDGNQVMLMIKVAEVQRNELKRFGISLESLLNTGNFVFGLGTGRGILNSAGQFTRTLDGDHSLFANVDTGSVDINGVIDALEDDGLVTVLAEPNLTTKSGVEANFLAGGEFPIPVSGEDGQVTIEYRSFGVSLNFTPIVMAENKISLSVTPEVSAISTTNAIQANGFVIPSLTTRRTSTTVELGSGQSFAIAGLMRNDHSNNIDKVPALGDVPMLGALFRSSEFRQNQTELVIIATPYIVRPVDKREDLILPTDGYTPATDMERILLGKLYSEQPFDNDNQPATADLQQSYGHAPRLHGKAGFIVR